MQNPTWIVCAVGLALCQEITHANDAPLDAGSIGPAHRSALQRAQTLNQQPESSLWRTPATLVFRYPGENTAQDDGFTVLDAMMKSPDPASRVRAIEGYAQYTSPEAIHRLLDGLFDAHPEVSAAAAYQLNQQFMHEQAANRVVWTRDRILERIPGPDETAQLPVNQTLAELRIVMAPGMLSVLSDDAHSVKRRRAAALCLGWMGCGEAADALAKTVWHDDAALALASVEALRRLGSPGLVPVWNGLLDHPSRPVRGMALEALAGLGVPEAFDALRAVAFRERGVDRALQERAISALAQWPAQVSVPVLLDVMERNPSLRALAAQMLRQKTGLNLGDMPGEWRRALEAPPTQ